MRAEIHYTSVKYIFRYLKGLFEFWVNYWRTEPRDAWSALQQPIVFKDNHDVPPVKQKSHIELYSYVDSDRAEGAQT